MKENVQEMNTRQLQQTLNNSSQKEEMLKQQFQQLQKAKQIEKEINIINLNNVHDEL